MITADVGQTDLESTTVAEHPTYESTTSPRPTYLPPSPTTTAATTTTTTSYTDDDTVEIEADPTAQTVAAPIGDCGGRLFLPHKSDCSKYYLCNFGKLTEHTCPPRLYWNENRCDWPENSKCRSAKRQVCSERARERTTNLRSRFAGPGYDRGANVKTHLFFP